MPSLNSESKFLDYGLLTAIAIASLIGINQYHYGMWNQFISIPWLMDLMNPELFPGDFLVDQREASPSFFLSIIALVMRLSGADSAQAHFGIYLVFLILTLFSFYRLALSFFKDRRAGILSAVMLAFAFPAIGDVQIWDSLLMERTIALPLLIFSMAYMLEAKWWPMLALQGLAFLVHPLSALYLIFISGLVILFVEGWSWRILGYAALILVLCAPVLYLRVQGSSGDSMWSFSEQWMEVMRLRNGHHAFPSAYPLLIWLKSAAFVGLFLLLLRFGSWKERQRKTLKAFAWGMLVMLFLGVLFTEVFPLRIVIQLQFFRSFLFLIILTTAMWSAALFHQVRPLFYFLFPFFLLQFVGVDVTKLAGMIIFAGLTWFLYRFFAAKKWKAPFLALAFLALGGAGWYLRGGLNIDQGKQKASWYEVQDWFAMNTAIDALAIIPPSEIGFRVRSQRASYGDWFDGTKAFFSEAYAQYWQEHMHNLGAKDPLKLEETYRALSLEHFQEIARAEESKHSEIYIVHFADGQGLKAEEVFSNSDYRIYRAFP